MRSDNVRTAIDSNLSALKLDPVMQAQILLRKDGELKMKKKLSVSMAIALALLLVTAVAVAAVLLGGKDVVDKLIVPKAMENQEEMFTQAEVDEIIAIARKQGVELSPEYARNLSRGEGYFKEELAMLFAKQQLGFYPGTWDVADQHWFGEFRVKIRNLYINYNTLPKEGEKTQEEIEAIAKAHIKETTGQDFPLDDRSRYMLERSLTETRLNPYQTLREWTLNYSPLSRREPGFMFRLATDGRIKEYKDNLLYVTQELPTADADTQVTVTVSDFLQAQSPVFNQLRSLTQEQLQALREQLKPWEKDPQALEGYHGFLLKQQFGPAPEGSISREQAIDIAFKAVQEKFKVPEQELRKGPAHYLSSEPYIYAVLLKAEGDYRWKVSFGRDYLAELDAVTGKVELMDVFSPGNAHERALTLDSLLPEEKRAYATPRPFRGTWAPNQPATPYPQPPEGFQLPQLFWDTLQKIDYKAETAQRIWDEALRDYGEDRRFWPQELQALDAFRFSRPEDTGEAIVGIPLPGEISADQALEAARAGLSDSSKGLYKADYLAELKPAITYYYNMPAEGRNAWRIAFVDVSGEEMSVDIADVMVDAKTGEVVPDSGERAVRLSEYDFVKGPMGDDGRSIYWGHKSIPSYYWEMMEQRNDTFESVLKILQEEQKRTDALNVGWSLEAAALFDLWANEYLAEGEYGLPLSGLPAPTDIQPDKAVEIAWAVFLEESGDKYAKETLQRLEPMVGFSFNVLGQGVRSYHVEFRDMEQPGYVTLGMVDLDATDGRILQQHSDAGNG